MVISTMFVFSGKSKTYSNKFYVILSFASKGLLFPFRESFMPIYLKTFFCINKSYIAYVEVNGMWGSPSSCSQYSNVKEYD